MGRNGLLAAMIAAAFITLFITSANATTGVENITLSSYSANTILGGNVTVNYTLTKISGYYAFGTNLYVVNNRQLIADNISVLITNRTGNPPIKGIMYVFVSHNTPLGTYNVTLNGNSTNTTVNEAVLDFDVLTQYQTTISTTTANTTSSAASTSVATTSTILVTAPSTTLQYGSAPKNGSYYLTDIIVVIILIVLFYVWMRSNRVKPKNNAGRNSKKS